MFHRIPADQRSGFMAISGCLITILSLGYSTFVQQLIGLELLPLYDGYEIGNIPRSETWDQQIGHGTSKPCRWCELLVFTLSLTKTGQSLRWK